MVAILVFLGVFAVTVLLILASNAGATERTKKTISRLEAVLAAQTTADDEVVDIRKHELFSTIPLLNRLLMQVDVAPQIRRLLYQARVKWTPGGLLLISLSCWVANSYFIHWKTGMGALCLVAGATGAAWPFAYIFHKRRKRFDKFEEGLPGTLDLIVSALRGGNSLISALNLAAREAEDPIGPELRTCYDEQNYGLEFRTAMENLAVRVPLQDVRIIVTAILIQKETGGNLAEVLDKCSFVIRERFRLKREVRTRTAQARMTGWVLALLPVGLGCLLYMAQPDVISLLWTRPLGLKMLYTASAMTAIGSGIIRKIVRIKI